MLFSLRRESRQAYLRFVWGRTRLPLNTSDWDQFSSDLMTYSKDNLLQLTAYIAKPFTTLYTTDVIITPITSNIT